jgi:hypothetical protein
MPQRIPFNSIHNNHPLIPAKAGIQQQLARILRIWLSVPAFRGESG